MLFAHIEISTPTNGASLFLLQPVKNALGVEFVVAAQDVLKLRWFSFVETNGTKKWENTLDRFFTVFLPYRVHHFLFSIASKAPGAAITFNTPKNKSFSMALQTSNFFLFSFLKDNFSWHTFLIILTGTFFPPLFLQFHHSFFVLRSFFLSNDGHCFNIGPFSCAFDTLIGVLFLF